MDYEIRSEGKTVVHNSGFKTKNLQSQKLNRSARTSFRKKNF